MQARERRIPRHYQCLGFPIATETNYHKLEPVSLDKTKVSVPWGNLLLASPRSGYCQHSVTCGHIIPISASVLTQLSVCQISHCTLLHEYPS